MPHRLILKVTKFQLPPPKRLGTVVKNILRGGGHHGPPPMSNRVNGFEMMSDCIHVRKTGYQNFGKQLKVALETRDFCINLGPKLVKIDLDSAEQLLYLVSQ